MRFIKSIFFVTVGVLAVSQVGYADGPEISCLHPSPCATLNGAGCTTTSIPITNNCKTPIYLNSFTRHRINNQSLYINGGYQPLQHQNAILQPGQTGQLVSCINLADYGVDPQGGNNWPYAPDAEWDMSVSNTTAPGSSMGQLILHVGGENGGYSNFQAYWTQVSANVGTDGVQHVTYSNGAGFQVDDCPIPETPLVPTGA